MRINNTNKILGIYNNNPKIKGEEKKNHLKRDQISISEAGKDYTFALSKVKETPEIRQEKVEALKAQIQSGQYHISTEDLADRILEKVELNRKYK